MTKKVIYTNKDNQDFEINIKIGKHIHLEIIGGNNSLYFLDMDEVNEFCEILKQEALLAFIK